MKLSEVLLKQDCRPPGFHSVQLTDASFDMSFEAGLVRITRKADGVTKLVALSNCICVTPAEEPKVAKKVA